MQLKRVGSIMNFCRLVLIWFNHFPILQSTKPFHARSFKSTSIHQVNMKIYFFCGKTFHSTYHWKKQRYLHKFVWWICGTFSLSKTLYNRVAKNGVIPLGVTARPNVCSKRSFTRAAGREMYSECLQTTIGSVSQIH